MRKFFLFLVLILLITGVSRSEMSFEFKCEGSNGSTMSSYSYLEEPSLQQTGYTRGLKAGSFNYLENGTIDLKEVIQYKYENGSPEENSTYSHSMEVDFNGEKSISEFYGKEFFKNNRAISAWKKIRYEEIKPPWKLGRTNMAKEIHVRSYLQMDTTFAEYGGTGYDLKYNASIKGGVAELKDTLAWSNKSGARRTVWEYEALMHGDVEFTNNLRESAPLVAHAGIMDWLPCCFKGTLPPNERMYTNWPSQIVVNTLQADTKVPQKNCIQKCYNNGTCKRECTDISCTPQNCSGYECVETVDQIGAFGISSLMVNEFLTNESSTGMYIENLFTDEESVKQVTYEIRIKNTGAIKLTSISVVDTLPAGMSLTSSSFKYEEDGTLDEPVEVTNPDGTTTLTWSIGDLSSDQYKTIQMLVHYVGEKSNAELNKVIATGSALGAPVEMNSDKAQINVQSLG